jgi:peptidoglycan/LPS O-acetylase OafA/YrhL
VKQEQALLMIKPQETRIANNFDVIRILFAWFVILSHSYVLNGDGPFDPLAKLTNGYMIFSFIGVKGFFIISGYLIFQSLERSKSIADYLTKRILRIFPALLVVLALTLLVVYFIYPLQNGYYLLDPEIYKYFLGNGILFMPHFFIKGVFENLPIHAINGSLWTIEFEFFFYIVLLLFFPIRKNKNLLKVLLSLILIGLFIGDLFFLNELKKITNPINLELAFDLGTYFLMGSFIACFNWDTIPFKIWIVLLSGLVLIIATIFKLNYAWVQISLPFIIIFLGKQSSKLATLSHQLLGDPSYGIYLYGFPVQQFIIYFFKPNTLMLLISSTLVCFAIGYLSWTFIEKKALMYKNIFSVKGR